MENDTTILVVDDNPANLSVLFEYLEESGYEVSVARSGERALHQLRHFEPDLILLDILMPGMDGFEVCRRLKEDSKTHDIPIIFMTSLTDSTNKMKGFLAGGADYITKPLQHEEVLARISAHLKIRRLEQQLQEQAIVRAYYDRLLSNISYDLQYRLHDLIGSLRRVVGHIDEYGIHEIKGQIGRLHTLAEALYDSHENLLIWAANQRGLLEYAPEHIDLYDLITYNLARFTPQAEKKKIMISRSIQQNTLVYADYNMVDTVMRNLLFNAIKFTEVEGQVGIMAHDVKEKVEIAVSDTGRGIDKEVAAHLFDIEPVAARGTPDGRAAAGLGLLLCREFVEKNGGTIWCQSEFGKGTTVTFTLPRAKEED